MENTARHNQNFHTAVQTQAMMPYLPPAVRDYIIRDANWRGVGPDPVFPRS